MLTSKELLQIKNELKSELYDKLLNELERLEKYDQIDQKRIENQKKGIEAARLKGIQFGKEPYQPTNKFKSVAQEYSE